ncbi:hypothetical protein [Ferruginibacter albus]|uniref:hypothetical protein n=1 Tax=Ferruginibacter albus TaxID=2875540 RepID=UPI001CC51414|nr:hypothetical protein [Ferruginibacter albus]UAY51097.1 hypothetical protein K9M53_10900 [Ferruginibacter albus]
MIKQLSIAFLSLLLLTDCSKKHTPEKNTTTKIVVPKGPWPKTLSLNDKVAKRAVDGRLYFDLDGKRYWKNYNDGKYYLFNKKMYDDPAFKPH